MSLDVDKHIKYYQRNLQIFPEAYTSYDSSRTSLVYFCIGGLAVLSEKKGCPLDSLLVHSRNDWIEWIYSNLVDSGEGFRGSSSHKCEGSPYDVANIAPTFFCLSMLAILRCDRITSRLNRNRIVDYITKCQREDGSFAGWVCPIEGVPKGDHDPRYTYMASAICSMLDKLEGSIDLDKAKEHIYSMKSYDGGLGDSSGTESHAGLTYCGIAALDLIGKLNIEDWIGTAGWLSKRQIPVHTGGPNQQDNRDEDSKESSKNQNGDNSNEQDLDCDDPEPDGYGGLNGRCNKPADTCYSFWCGGSLAILNHLDFLNSELNEEYLLNHTQHKMLGGFSKHEGTYPDPMHSYLGLASLALHDSKFKFDPSLCLPRWATEYMHSLEW